MSRVVVKNLPDKITKEKLHQLFSEKGVVTDVQLKFTKDGRFRKFAFVGFQTSDQAEAARKSFNKSFINTSRIQVEVCAELGDPNKPRPWSKYAPENAAKKKRKNNKSVSDFNNPKIAKKVDKEKIRDPKVKELIKSHAKDTLFTEFLEVNAPELASDVIKCKDEEDLSEENETENEDQEIKNTLANQDISDADYIKLKTGKDVNLKTDNTVSSKLKTSGKPAKNIELFVVKLKGLPFKVKKNQIKEFFNPLKPFTIRKALKQNGLAYCGFKTEKEMKSAVFKNKSFLGGKRIYVTPVKKEHTIYNKNEEIKRNLENEKLKGLETVAESGRIYVRNLAYTVTEDDLKPCFEKYGPLSEFNLPIDSFTRKPKGFAFVTFLIPEHGCKAFNELDGTVFAGRMLHLLPALPSKESEDDFTDDSFKKKKIKKEQAMIGSNINWNTFFIGENALAETIAATYNTTKENVLDDSQSRSAVRLALGETQIVNKVKNFLEENGVCLEAFQNMTDCPRSKTVILVKNLPFGTKPEDLREIFSKYGLLKKVVLPPSGVACLVEFIEPSEAKTAFRRLSYSKFKHVPLYLEWAPDKVFTKDFKSDFSETRNVINTSGEELCSKELSVSSEETKNENLVKESNSEVDEKTFENHTPVEGATIFVKNLNFSTEEAAVKKHFETCGTVVSVTIAKKKDPKQPGKVLSMGYGFVEYLTKGIADKALKTLQFSNLDDHKVELKRSNRTLAPNLINARKAPNSTEKPSTKILVRNVPFQAKKRELEDLFKVFGEIKALRLPKKMVGAGSHRGFCFVEYNTIHDSKRAFKALSQSTHLYGRRLVLEWASTDDDVETLRLKTAKHFQAGDSAASLRKKITIEEEQKEDDD